MTAREQDIINGTFHPDGTADMFPAPLSTQLTLTNAQEQQVFVMKDPNGSGDSGWYGSFPVPLEYSSTPTIRVRGIIDGTPANTLAFLFSTRPLADSEAVDQAYADTDLAENATWTGYADEDVFEITITLTPTAAFVPKDDVPFLFAIDDSQQSFTGNFLLTGLYLGYDDGA